MIEIFELIVKIDDGVSLSELFGSLDRNVKILENEFNVKILNTGEGISLKGEELMCQMAAQVLDIFAEQIEKNGLLTDQNINYTIAMVKKGKKDMIDDLLDETIIVTASGRPIKTKTIGQKFYVDAISKKDIVFGIGPAGTGKTYLAMAKAISAFRKKEVNRIILTRPAVEAGESLGFLPGDLNEKIDPYLRPLYDALYEIMGYENYLKLVEKGVIEVAPLAYMRGRTLDSAYVILDEAQNTTSEQMKMFLTRLGYGSKAIVTGDITQIDLPRGRKSGLKTVQKILSGIDDIAFVELTRNDIVRHPLVQKIIDAYESFEEDK